MSYTNKIISTNSDEFTFIKTFITNLINCDERITWETKLNEITSSNFDDLETQYNTANSTPSFTININNRITITFKRGLQSSVQATGYTITSNCFTISRIINFSSSGSTSSTTSIRTWKFVIAANQGSVCLSFDGYNVELGKYAYSFCTISEDNVSGYSGHYLAGANAISQPFYMNDGSSIVKTDRLPYIYDSNNETNVEIIANKVFITSNSSNRKVSLKSFCDVSTVAANQIMYVNNKKYYSVDTHTLMEV